MIIVAVRTQVSRGRVEEGWSGHTRVEGASHRGFSPFGDRAARVDSSPPPRRHTATSLALYLHVPLSTD